MNREYVYDNFWTHEEGEPLCYFEIYEKIEDKYIFVVTSTNYFDDLQICQQEAENHIDLLHKEMN